MNTEQELLLKWQVLSSEKKQEVLDLLDKLYQQEIENQEVTTYQPKTPLGKKLWELRLKSRSSQPTLMTWDEVNQEVASRRGGNP